MWRRVAMQRRRRASLIRARTEKLRHRFPMIPLLSLIQLHLVEMQIIETQLCTRNHEDMTFSLNATAWREQKRYIFSIDTMCVYTFLKSQCLCYYELTHSWSLHDLCIILSSFVKSLFAYNLPLDEKNERFVENEVERFLQKERHHNSSKIIEYQNDKWRKIVQYYSV